MFCNKNCFPLCVGVLLSALTACEKDQCVEKVTYEKKTPQYQSPEEIRQKVAIREEKALRDPGKLYLRTDGYLFIGERHEGIHILDNANPKNPQKIGFVRIPGNTDMAVKDDIMYANSFIDLYAIDISSPSHPQIVNRMNDVFDQSSMPGDGLGKMVEGEGVIVDYEVKEVTESVDCSGRSGNTTTLVGADNASTGTGAVRDANLDPSPSGIRGSMARFAIDGNYLYGVDWRNLKVFNIHNPQNPSETNEKSLGWGIETIFPYEDKDKLFIGSQTGMFIYDNSNPTDPTRISEFEHATMCDPVYPTDSFAYVTLNGNGECGRQRSELNVVNITDMEDPWLMEEYPMDDPQGLAVKNQTLFLCDGNAGLKVYNTENKYTITDQRLDHKNAIHAYDVIPYNKILMVIGESGLYQYNYDDPGNLQRLSRIPVMEE